MSNKPRPRKNRPESGGLNLPPATGNEPQGSPGPNSASKRKKRHVKAKPGQFKPQKALNDTTPSSRSELKIVAGTLRGRTIEIDVDPKTRPMKNRTREAIFNLLGQEFDDEIAFDLFAGSGVIAMEALSRGCRSAHAIELSVPMVREMRQNSARLGLDNQLEIHLTSAFHWTDRQKQLASQMDPPSCQDQAHVASPHLVFVCPPYSLWESAKSEMLALINDWIDLSPAGSQFVLELNDEDYVANLPTGLDWDVRRYFPAYVALAEKPA